MLKKLSGWLALVLPWSSAARFALWIAACILAALMCVFEGAPPRATTAPVPGPSTAAAPGARA
jgi:hypothetical protein